MQQFRRMDGCAPGKMLDLHAARKPRRDYYIIGTRPPNRREELLFADLPRNLVMLLFVAERPRHAAATGVEVDDLGAGDAPHKPHERLDAHEGALMTMGMNENPANWRTRSR